MQKKSVGLRIKGKDRIMPYVKLGHLSTIKSLFERRVCVRTCVVVGDAVAAFRFGGALHDPRDGSVEFRLKR